MENHSRKTIDAIAAEGNLGRKQVWLFCFWEDKFTELLLNAKNVQLLGFANIIKSIDNKCHIPVFIKITKPIKLNAKNPRRKQSGQSKPAG